MCATVLSLMPSKELTEATFILAIRAAVWEGNVDVVRFLLDASFHSGLGFALHLASTDFADCVCVALRRGVSGILWTLILDAAPMEEGGLLRGLLDEERSLVVMALTEFANRSPDTTLFTNALKHMWSYETSCLVVLFEAIRSP